MGSPAGRRRHPRPRRPIPPNLLQSSSSSSPLAFFIEPTRKQMSTQNNSSSDSCPLVVPAAAETRSPENSSLAVAAAPMADAGGAYEDLLPVMAGRLGTAGLLAELRAGFRVLADPARGAITAESLRRSAGTVLGVDGMTAEEAEAMVREGDHDGDGALSEREFCVLMVRLSPGIMADAEGWLQDAIAEELLMPPTPTRSPSPPPPSSPAA